MAKQKNIQSNSTNIDDSVMKNKTQKNKTAIYKHCLFNLKVFDGVLTGHIAFNPFAPNAEDHL